VNTKHTQELSKQICLTKIFKLCQETILN